MSNNKTLSTNVSNYMNTLVIQATKRVEYTYNIHLDLDDILLGLSALLPQSSWEDYMTYKERDEKVKEWFFSLDEATQLKYLAKYRDILTDFQEQSAFDDTYEETFDNMTMGEMYKECYRMCENINEKIDPKLETTELMTSVTDWFNKNFTKRSNDSETTSESK